MGMSGGELLKRSGPDVGCRATEEEEQEEEVCKRKRLEA
jgi:hypothetical protein